MRLTSPQMEAFETLENKIKNVVKSSSKWGIAFLGPNGYGKTEVIKFLIEKLTSDELKFIRLDLFAPIILPEPRVNMNWEEYIKQVKDLLPDTDFKEIEKINSSLNKMSKIASICKENKKRIFVVLDHLELCQNWREARWPIENEVADLIVVCDDDVWNDRKEDRAVTSFFFKRVHLKNPIDFERDQETFCEIIAEKFELEKPTAIELFKKISKEYSERRIPSWNDILRMVDELEMV